MIIIPAIDLMDGQAVRLVKGDFATGSQVASDPVEAALHWQALGASRIHVIDLDGARQGCPANVDTVEAILSALDVPVEVGGGIRTQEDAEQWLEVGARWVILGTPLAKEPDLFQRICEAHPGAVIGAVDGRGERVSVDGWQRDTEMGVVDLALFAQRAGAAEILYTDVDRDGTLTGPNLERTRQIAEALTIPVIASGGVSSLDDVLRLPDTGAAAVVVGKALYAGKLDLGEAIRRVSSNQ